MSKQASDISAVGRWFLGNALPWSDGTESKLVTLGVTCVEHLKECTDEEWANLFAADTIITQRVAARVIAGLKNKGKLDPKKCAFQLGIVQASRAPPPLSSLSRRGKSKDDGTSFKLTAKGITVKYISKETKKRIRLSTFAAARAAIVDIMDDVGEGDDASLGGATDDLSGGAGDVEDVLDSVSMLDGGEEDGTGGDISDSDSEEEEDTEEERNPRRIRSWRDGRCVLSKDLYEPAPPDERLTWDSDLVGVEDRCDDLEDPEGYYMTMRCSKSSSDDEIDRQLKRLRKIYRSIALK